jgi:predicted ATPase
VDYRAHKGKFSLGYLDQARMKRDEGVAEAWRLSPYDRAYAQCLAWYGNWAIDGTTSVRIMLQPTAEVISNEHGFPLWIAVGNIMRGWCLGAAGQSMEGLSTLTLGIEKFRATGANLMTPFFLTTLAHVHGMAGEPERGLNPLADATKVVETTQERWSEAEIHRLRGALLLLMNDAVVAEHSYGRAITVARQQSAKFWELRASLDLARLWRDQGKRPEARDLLAPIYGWFTEGFDTPVLRDAKALLDQLA